MFGSSTDSLREICFFGGSTTDSLRELRIFLGSCSDIHKTMFEHCHGLQRVFLSQNTTLLELGTTHKAIFDISENDYLQLFDSFLI